MKATLVSKARCCFILAVALVGSPLGADEPLFTATRVATVPSVFDRPLASARSGLFFETVTPHLGLRLWRSLGTEATTRPLLQTSFASQWLLGERGSQVFFSSYSFRTGVGILHAFDGQTGRTVPLLNAMIPMDAALATDDGFFFTDWTRAPLYRSDGKPGRAAVVHPGPIAGNLASLGRDLLFWVEDTPGGPATLNRVRGSTVTPLGAFPSRGVGGFVRSGRRAAFRLPAAGGGEELWMTDGTPGGTLPVALAPVGFVDVAACGGEIVFFPNVSPGVWATDGTVTGTRPLADPARPPFLPPDPAAGVFDAGDGCYFLTNSFDVTDLWKTDLTPAGTLAVSEVPKATSVAAARGRLFFSRFDKLWTSNGTAAGTREIAGPFMGTPENLVAAGDRLYFVTREDDSHHGLWRLDLPVGIRVEDADVKEPWVGTVFASLPVTLSRPADHEIQVDYQTEDSTATSSDFEAASGTLRFAPGQRSQMIRVRVKGDGAAEATEAFRLKLSNPQGGEIERGLASGTVRDATSMAPPRR